MSTVGDRTLVLVGERRMYEDILVVDDDALSLRLVRHLLASHGYTAVRTATSAAEALAAIGHARPRVILMDLRMPGMSGLTLTRQLKADRATREITVIAVTACAMDGDAILARAAGCDDYVSKPIDQARLLRLVAFACASERRVG
jgi:CheY-like chemotaxis protein